MVNCPIVSYQVTSVDPHVTQPGCPGAPDATPACKSLTLDTTDLALDGYNITFKILADGEEAEATV